MAHSRHVRARAWSGPPVDVTLRRTRILVLSLAIAGVEQPASAVASTPLVGHRCDITWPSTIATLSAPSSRYAPGTFLLYLQNDSDGEVRLNFDLPFGWVGPTPAYPITVTNRQMLIDERKYDEILETSNLIACRTKAPEWTGKRISNVALPTSCDNNTSVRMRVAATATTYYLTWCKDEVVMKPGSAKYTPKDHAGVKFFAMHVDKSGTPTLKKVQ